MQSITWFSPKREISAEANEMTLVEGEVIVQIDQVDEGWWFGVSEDGKKEGLFPCKL